MNFNKEVKPFIEKYMNIVFRAYDDYGAEIVFPNGLSINWDIDDDCNITKVTIESDTYDVVSTTERGFKEILSIVEFLTISEIDFQEHRKKIDQEYIKLLSNFK